MSDPLDTECLPVKEKVGIEPEPEPEIETDYKDSDSEKVIDIEAEAVNGHFDIYDGGGYFLVNKPYDKMTIELIKYDADHSILALSLFNNLIYFRNNSTGKKGNDGKNVIYKTLGGEKVDDQKRTFNLEAVNLEKLCLISWERQYREADDSQKLYLKRKVSASLNFLNDNNIFYFWKCGRHYIFYMEKNVSLWKIYNPTAKIMPKTLLKLTNQYNIQLDIMFRVRNLVEKNIERKEVWKKVGDSYVEFVKSIIAKMSEDTSRQLLKIPYNGDVVAYMDKLTEKLLSYKPYHGYTESDEFMDNIPLSIRSSLNTTKCKKYKAHGVDVPESILIEKDRGTLEQDLFDFDPKEDPFSGPKQLIYYYRNRLSLRKKRICRFSNKLSKAKINVAEKCLKILKERQWNEDTLEEWICYFADNELKGKRCNKASHTSFVKFYESLNKFKENEVIE